MGAGTTTHDDGAAIHPDGAHTPRRQGRRPSYVGCGDGRAARRAMDTLEGVACIAAAIGVTTALMLGKGPFDGSIAAAIVIAVIDVVPMAVGGTMVLASIAGEAMAKGDGRRTTGDTPHDDGTAAHGAMAADAE